MPEDDTSYTELAVAIGRVEEGIKGLKTSVDGLVRTSERHASQLNAHEVEIARLRDRQGPRVHWLTVVLGIIAIAGFALSILNQLYK